MGISIAIGKLLFFLLDVCLFVIIAQVVLSWLITFEVINIRNPQASNLVRLIDKLTDPVYRPLRKLVPPVAGFDLTPLIVVFAIYLLQSLVGSIFLGF